MNELEDWTIYDPRSPETEITTQEQEKIDYAKDREKQILPVVQKYFPNTNFLALAARQEGVEVDQLDDDLKRYALGMFKEYSKEREELVGLVNKTSSTMSNEQRERFVSLLHECSLSLNTGSGIAELRINPIARSCETIEDAEHFAIFAKEWGDKFISQDSNKPKESKDWSGKKVFDPPGKNKADEFLSFVEDVSDLKKAVRPPKRSYEEQTSLFQANLAAREYAYSLPNNSNSEIVRKFQERVLDNGLRSHDSKQIELALELLKGVINTEDEVSLKIFLESVGDYGRLHSLTDKSIIGLKEKLLPAIEKKDPQVEVLERNRNIWGMSKEEFGIGGFTCLAYSSEITPANLNELLLVARNIPTTHLARFEQNRKDALLLARSFGILRDFIHDQRPYVHEFIQAMVEYHDSDSDERLKSLLPKTYMGQSDRSKQFILNKENYEKEFEEVVNGTTQNVKAIDLLRRLVENTAPFDDKPPITSDNELNQSFEKLVSQSELGQIPTETLGSTLNLVNKNLIKKMSDHEIGIEPNTLLALGWLERQGFKAMQNISYEDQISLFKQDWFKQLLEFIELTYASKEFDKDEFEGFFKEIQEEKSYQKAAPLLFQRVISNIAALADKYKIQGKQGEAEALWSGNIVHELMSLVDYKEAETAVGNRLRKEQVDPSRELMGD